MKRLLVVLFGVLVFQGSVWAQFDGMSSSCRKAYPIGSNTGAKILHPVSAGVVLKKKAPFLLQWKDVEVSQTVNIRLYKKGAEGKDLFGKRLNNRPNTGTALITKQDFKRAKVKAGEQYFFQVEWKAHKNALWQVISSECFTFNVKQKEDLQCYNATTVKDCLQALIEQNRQTAVEMRELTERLEALEGGGGTVGGGDGGDIDLNTPEGIKLACNGDNPGLFSIETCKGQPWVAANGIDVAKNPVCWDTKYAGWQVDGKNPWVVGTAAEYNNAAYDCRTKCADESGAVFDHCAADGWWDNAAARSTVCEFGEGGRKSGLLARWGWEERCGVWNVAGGVEMCGVGLWSGQAKCL